MADIDLVKAYQDFADLLAEYGHDTATYCIDLEVWNHRTSPPRVNFRLSAMVGPSGCEQVYAAPSLDVAFADMRRRLEQTGLGTVALPLPDGAATEPPAPVITSSGGEGIPF